MRKLFFPLLSSHAGMMFVCCAAMIGAFFLAGAILPAGSIWVSLLPLAACVGMHFVMHKFMGVDCHKSKEGQHAETEQDAPPAHPPKVITVPVNNSK